MSARLSKIPVKCQYCDKECSNKYTLATHQKTTKYCLDKQREVNNVEIVEDLYECPHCGLKVSIRTKDRHINTCRQGLHAQISDKETAMSDLRIQAEMYKKLYENTQVHKQDGCTQTETCVEESAVRVEELEEALIKCGKLYTKYKRLYAKSLNKKVTAIETQTDNHPDEHTKMSDMIASLTEQVAQLQAEVETFRNTPSTSRVDDVTIVDPNTKIAIPTDIPEGHRLVMIGNLPMIVRISDGYINATELSKAAVKLTGKKRRDYSHWKEQANGFLEALSRRTGIPVHVLIYSVHGFVNKKRIPVMIHPLAAVKMTEWMNDDIGLQYMIWAFEIQLRGTVTVGQEHTIAENVAFLQTQVTQLTNDKTELLTFNQLLDTNFRKLQARYSTMLERVSYPEFNDGEALYIIEDLECGVEKFKVGIAKDMTNRLDPYHTYISYPIVHFLVHCNQSRKIESMVKEYFSAVRKPKNSEWFHAEVEELITFVKTFLVSFKIEHTIENNLEHYNDFVRERYEIYKLTSKPKMLT